LDAAGGRDRWIEKNVYSGNGNLDLNRMDYVHISSKVESRIEALRKAGKVGTALAKKVTRLIGGLASGAFSHHMDEVGSYTKYGEKRIK
jgi:hypothetical protein